MSNSKRSIVTTLRIALWAVLLLAGASLILGAMQRKENAEVHGLQIDIQPLTDGNFLINKDDVPLILEDRFAHDITTFPVGELDVERLERVLEEHPFVHSSEAFVDAQNVINIQLVQREPLLRVLDNNGLNYYLDEDGEQLPPSPHYAARVRVATGFLPPYEQDFLEKEGHLLNQVYQLNELLRADPFLDALIEQIYLNKRGEMILSPKVGKQTILLGRFHNTADKLERLKTFYQEGLPYKGWRAYRSFDLRYSGQVVCKKR